MKIIRAGKIKKAVSELCIEANINLGEDILKYLRKAFMKEKNTKAKKILETVIENAYFARKQNLPICQDTGMAVVFCEIGDKVKIAGGNIKTAINQGVKAGYKNFRKSVVRDPLGSRKNTKDNTPAIIHFDIVKGEKIKITLLAKGFGCENKSKIMMFNPTAKQSAIENFIVKSVKDAGADACPPYVVGVGIGGTQDIAALLSKKATLENLDKRNSDKTLASAEEKLLKKINRSNIGPMGLGGRATALSLKIKTHPTHIAGLPVCVNISCHATRYASRTL